MTLRSLFFSPFKWVLERLEERTALHTVAREYRGVRICQSRTSVWCNQEFVTTIEQALQLVDAKDPLRFARITRAIRYVRPHILPGPAAQYIWSSRICRIDWRRVVVQESEVRGFVCAILLVHESTHGLVHARGPRLTKRSADRIEELCRAEETRFASHVDPRLGPLWRAETEDRIAQRLKRERRGLVARLREAQAAVKETCQRNAAWESQSTGPVADPAGTETERRS